MRLIDADALLRRAVPMGWSTPLWVSNIVIEDAPTIDAVEVVHGYNRLGEYKSMFKCSVCDWECWDTLCGDTETYNYCPNCGAKMEENT